LGSSVCAISAAAPISDDTLTTPLAARKLRRDVGGVTVTGAAESGHAEQGGVACGAESGVGLLFEFTVVLRLWDAAKLWRPW